MLFNKCASGSCRFFKWDDSALPFIRHPTEAYAAAGNVRGNSRRPVTLSYMQQKAKETVLTKTTVKIVFLLLSKTLIGMKAQKNLTIDPVIAKIEHIAWNEKLSMWTIPASLRVYNNTIAALPTDIPNIQVDIDPIPTTLIDTILMRNDILVNNPDFMSEVELKWTEFVESPMRKLLKPFQQEAVRLGIEKKGRILLGNENGIGLIEQALALANVYKDEWPVLLMCPAILCETWKETVQNFFDLEEDEICILDNVVGGLFKETSISLKKRKKENRTKKNIFNKRIKGSASFNSKQTEEYGLFSSDEEDEEYDIDNDSDEAEIYKMTCSSPIKFYIASHKKVSKNKTKIYEQKFKVMIIDASHYLKSRDQNQVKNISKMLQDHPRAILLSDTAIYSLPIDLYNQINVINPSFYPDADTYITRYCNPKTSVFGVFVNGRSNMEELNFVLDTHIWYCPKLADMKSEYKRPFQPYLTSIENGEEIAEEYIQEKDLLKKTSIAKKNAVCEYIEHVFNTYKRPKIAITYYDDSTSKSIEDIMKKRKVVNLVVTRRNRKKNHFLSFLKYRSNILQ
ncbi:uncharacterized protein BX663DRAFT_513946 [Cokeromyces recurvatus]|uniref:uncharacterized protein n=1 Tax=Cokeromyces recurvatus TaxID=90255 RepID=UPI00221FAE17|nr:uncharacterized protein BX663DRAFT_513946 [Cokeromyces recurvatus]KAI7901754.1 hypothetical protein BX663DRAFT_513946 [Cokeromyces recurvatus]